MGRLVGVFIYIHMARRAWHSLTDRAEPGFSRLRLRRKQTERNMGLVLAVGLGLMAWTAASVLWLFYQMASLMNLGTGRKDNWATYVIAAPVIAILFVVRLFKRERK